jgi:hypothetical protein
MTTKHAPATPLPIGRVPTNHRGNIMQTVYTQRANGRQEYWTYCDGDRINISKGYALRLIADGERLVELA